MIKAAIYLRSSKDRSDVSIDAQRRQLQDLAKQRDILIVEEFADAVESGKDDDRPSFQNLLRAMRNQNRGWDHVLVLDTARIARRRHISIIFEEHECKRNNIRVIYNSLPDSDPITEMLLKSILQAMDEWHSLTSKVKGLAGMSENVKQGFRAGGRAPRGYKLDKIETGAIRDGMPVTKSKLIPDDEALIVRAYLQSRARGVSRTDAAKASNINAPASSLIDIERNSLTYAGQTVWNRTAERDGSGYVGGRKYRPRSEWVINKNTHEALISEEEAEKILAAVGETSTRQRKASRTYLFSGIMKDQDGNTWNGDGAYYRLKGNGRRILAESVEKPAIKMLLSKLNNDYTIKAVLKHYKSLANEIDQSDTKALAKQLTTIDKSINKLADLISETTAPDALLRKIESLELERNAIAGQIESVNEEQKMYESLKTINESDVKRVLITMVESMEESTPDQLKGAVLQMIESVTLNSDTFTADFTWKIPSISGDKVASPRGVEPLSPP